MKPTFDISNKQSFTVWESGCWQPELNFGSSVLVADIDSGKLQVIYDRAPTKNSLHALFYANVGGILAGSNVKKQGDQMLFHIDLVKIDSLTTVIKQGMAVPEAETTVLYLSRKLVDPSTAIRDMIDDMPNLPSLPNIKEMMELAILKSLTPLSQQKLFWGLPRQTVTNDE
jgi:hypothetical protein